MFELFGFFESPFNSCYTLIQPPLKIHSPLLLVPAPSWRCPGRGWSGIQFDMYQYYSIGFGISTTALVFSFVPGNQYIRSCCIRKDLSTGVLCRFVELLKKILRRQKVWRYLWLWWLWWPESAAQLVGWKVRLSTPWHGKHLWWNDVCEQQYVHIYIYTHVLGQWLKFKPFGITYWVRKIKFKLLDSGSIG